MRIGDRHHSFSSGRDRKESDRQRTFRSTYRVGDLVLGTLVDYQTDSMAWVQIDELRVLAQLTRKYSPGSQIGLVVTALHPDIILREARDQDRKRPQGLHLIV
ncbi:hypothetical protein [Desulfoplanes formicivorans]|uniref:S1 motif domain-containing protein n=1 Tax=Desulfoplanes formicivorans TaxID=1592317 RepID=A0A194AK05_9BACT|nr:hypothetical protein [Desulfoplanes formicivorans]GAU09054.1 hypothetical protein DPF_1774 [Desulfoplanes formicivorans]